MTLGEAYRRPKSAIPVGTGILGTALVPLLFFVWPDMPSLSSEGAVSLYLLVLFGGMAAFEIFVARTPMQPGTGLRPAGANWTGERHTATLLPKLVGVAVCIGLALGFYGVADLYQSDWYSPFFAILSGYWPLILGALLLNTVTVHFMMRHPADGYWALGRWVMSFGREAETAKIRETLLALGIKTFFLPLMFCYLVYDWEYLQGVDPSGLESFREVYSYLYRFIFFFDLSFVVVGYAFAMRVLNSHIRWSEPTLGGWVACLVCYAPFWQLLSREYFNYFDAPPVWADWLGGSPVLYTLWGSTILLLLSIYAFGGACFGLRFSNLTYRGVVCHGPFAWSKHPQYVTKNLSWWMIDVPFIAADLGTGLSNCLALAGVNAIYVARARFEERCLSRAPSYRRYKAHIERNGLLARWVLPFLPFTRRRPDPRAPAE